MQRRGSVRTHGFTLAEVVVAVTILGMMGGLVFGTFGHAMESRDRAEALTARYGQIRQAMLRMSREISMAYLSTHRNCEEARTQTLFTSQRSGGGTRLNFTSFSHFKTRADANESDQQELSYFVDSHAESKSRTALFRRQQGRVDEEADEGGRVQLLAPDITDLQFEFYDPKSDRWSDDWDSTSSDYKERLPMFVTIRVKAAAKGGSEELFVTKTRIFLRGAIRIFGTGFAGCLE